MELREYIRILRNRWLFILSATITGAGLAIIISLLITPQFRSTVQLYVSVRSASTEVYELVQGADYARQIVASYVDVVETSLVLHPVIEELGLQITPDELAQSLEVASPADTVLITISATSIDAQQAADIANATGESFSRVVQTQLEGDGENDLNSAVQLTITEPAVAATSPHSPNALMNLALGLALGAFLGGVIAVLRSILDTRFHTLRDVELFTDKPILGSISLDPDAKKRPLIVHDDPHNPLVEPYRSLRTNLQFLDSADGERSFVFAGTGPLEGTTVTTANLAISLAETGASVVLVDGNLRRPTVAQYLGIKDRMGLTDVLRGLVEVDDVIHRWGSDDLWVVTAGHAVPNPSELLGSVAMDDLLEELGDSYEYILIDCPPVLVATDPVVLGKKTAGIVLVIASGSTRKPDFDSALGVLEAVGSQILGLVVTRLPLKGPDSYGYGYGYGYGDIEARLKASLEEAEDD